MIEPIRGADFQTRGLLLALKAGEPSRIARALAMEAAHRSSTGTDDPQVATLLRAAEEIAGRLDSPYLHGMVAMVRGAGSLLQGQWKLGTDRARPCRATLPQPMYGTSPGNATPCTISCSGPSIQRGEIAELKRRWTLLYRESQERGDLYAATTLTAFYMTMITLSKNEPIESERELEAFVDRRDKRRFSLQHSSALESLIHLYLYRGDVSNAWARLGAIWPAYSRSMLLRIKMIRIDLLELRGRTALAMAEKAVDQPEFPPIRPGKTPGRWNMRGNRGHSLTPHYLEGRHRAPAKATRSRAIRELALAVEHYDRAEMPLRAQILRFRLGEIQSDDETRAAARQGRGSGSPSRGSSPRPAGPACMLRAS